MAVNVTQKDATLREIIEYCENRMACCRQFAYPTDSRESVYNAGCHRAYDDVLRHCRERLGYTGHMPLEVPNQSEQSHVMTTALSNLDWGRSPQFDHYECSCGYSARDPYEAESHINVRKQLGQSVYWKEATES